MSAFELTPEEMELFLQEANEQVDTMEELLVTLESGAGDDALAAIFRAAHTLKGGAATAGMQRTAELTHVLESLLDQIRSGNRDADADTVDALLDAVDWLRTNLRIIEQHGIESDADVSDIVARLEAAADDGEASEALSYEAAIADDVPDAPPARPSDGGGLDELLPDDDDVRQKVEEAARSGKKVLAVDIRVEADAPMPSIRLYQSLMVLEEKGSILFLRPERADIESGTADHRDMHALLVTDADVDAVQTALGEVSHLQFVRSVDVFSGAEGQQSATESVRETDAQREMQKSSREEQTSDQAAQAQRAAVGVPAVADTVRVSVQVLDRLMNLVGELVIDRTRLARLGTVDLPLQQLREELSLVGGHINRITTDLQDTIMNARMVPLETLFRRFPRMVRDLSRGLDKKVRFEIVGEDTELDRAVIEHIGDPLVHMIRNAIDHGLESPEERTKAGKDPEGTVTLAAYHRENHIYIEVTDDGRGINPERVKRSALEKGLISVEQAAQLHDNEALNLLFLPGFSTSGEVTAVSGRGVGLDVVRRNIERVNGTVSVDSKLGRGTRWTIRLPLTLAIVQALLVGLNDSTFAVPLDAVREIVQMTPDMVHLVNGRRVATVREQVIPLVNPGEVWGERYAAAWDGEGRAQVVVLQGAGGALALVVDELFGEQETVIKAIDGLGGQVRGISGASILGDGSVALIIDVAGFTQEVRELGYTVRQDGRTYDRSA